jgi:hypothetical protein
MRLPKTKSTIHVLIYFKGKQKSSYLYDVNFKKSDMKSQNHRIKSLLLLLVVFFTSCLRDKCGDNISLGEFELIPQSFTDWYPYRELDTLRFENKQGEIISLGLTERTEVWSYQSMGEFCNEGWADSAEEYFLGQWIQLKYSGTFDGINYFIEALLFVDVPTDPASLKLYDYAVFSSMTHRQFESSGVGASVYIIANNRNNTFSQDEVLVTRDFAEEMEINGEVYSDIWYFNRGGVPSMMVQKGKGIIAFAGLNEEIWSIISP